MKRLAVIPARSGSKRIPHKNIKGFCGRPMISYPIKAAVVANLFDTIHVSTESNKIADVASNHGCRPDFLRPHHLSGDHTSMMEVLKFVVEEYEKLGNQFDTVALLYATSPLMDPNDLQKACYEFEKGDREKALLAVAAFPSPIEQAFRMTEDLLLYPANDIALETRTQDLPHAYFDAGMFAFYSTGYVKNSTEAGNFFSFRGFKVPLSRVTDIDWPDDWNYAETLYKVLHSKS